MMELTATTRMHTLSLVSATITLSSATGYFVATLLVSAIVVHGEAFQPEFTEPITNLTVPVGRDAVFRCLVQHLGGYRVGWVKVDTKAIQAIHHNLITHNPRVSISHSNHVVWNLHIRGVQEEDGGVYMCQINTDPMLSQTGTLKVVVSPDFVFDETSGDILVGEGASTFLTCKATGRPSPRIEWRREDGKEVILRNGTSRVRVPSIDGPIFNMSKISRSEMGSYFCIAANGVPPAVSKRITVSVTFSPVIQVPNQLVGAPAGTDVTVECIIESFPKSINYWLGTAGEMLLTDNKHDVLEIVLSPYELQMSLTVKNFQRRDVGTYACMAKNSFGGVESSIRLYEIPGPTGPYHFNFDEEDYNEQYGSAENERDVQLSNRVAERGRRPSLQLTLGSARSTRHTYSSNHVPLNRASTCTTISISITSVTVFSLFVFILFTM